MDAKLDRLKVEYPDLLERLISEPDDRQARAELTNVLIARLQASELVEYLAAIRAASPSYNPKEALND